MEFFTIGVLNAHPDVAAHAFVGHKVQRIEVNPASEGVADLIAVTAIQQKFTWKTEVTVILQPQLQAVLMAQVAQSSDVIPRDPVSHQPAHIPKKPV
jgi:hypothetical protein